MLKQCRSRPNSLLIAPKKEFFFSSFNFSVNQLNLDTLTGSLMGCSNFRRGMEIVIVSKFFVNYGIDIYRS